MAEHLDDVQQELDRLLHVEPSHEFLARARSRVADDPIIGASWMAAWVPSPIQWGSSLAIVITAAAVYWSWSMPDATLTTPAAPSMTLHGDLRLPLPLPVLTVTPTVAVDKATPGVARRAAPREMLVLVSDTEVQGLRMFAVAVHEGVIGAADLPGPVPTGELSALEPLTVIPLAQAVGLAEEQQQ